MELIHQLRSDGIAKGMCRPYQGKIHDGLSISELAQLYFSGVKFCISKDFPTLDFLREHFRGKCEPFGVYIDDEIPPVRNKPDIALNGACKAMLEYDGYSVSRLYVRHDSEAAVVVSDHAVVTIDLFDRAKIFLSVAGSEAHVIVNRHGAGAEVELMGLPITSKVIVNYHDKNTY